MTRRITDSGVAGLPVREGRAELLEEIMSMTEQENPHVPDVDERRGRRHPWLSAAAAAAAVAAVVVGVVWLGDQQRDDRVEPAPADGGFGSGDRAVLDQAGWELDNVQDGPDYGGEVDYVKGDQQLSVHWRRAADYDAYVADRQEIGDPEQVDLLGRPSLMWAYSATDHTVIRPVEGDHMLEVRGSGMDEAAFRALLDDLVLVDEEGLEERLPDEAVLDAERPAAVTELLDELPLPEGFDRAGLASHELSRYHLIADVTGAVTCAWVEQFDAGRKAHDTAAVRAAQDALRTARDWPMLQEIVDQGDWSEAVWDYADIVVAGAPTAEDRKILGGVEEGLGCD